MKNAIFPVYASTSRFMIWAFACLLLAAGISAQAANPPTANAVIGVEPAILSGNRVMVRIHLKEPMTGTPAGFTVGNPPRIAMDLPDTGNAIGKNTVEAYLGPLVSVNVVQAGTRTRLVFNLNKPVEYETRIEGKALIVSFNETGAAAATTTNVSPRFAEAAPAAARHSIKNVDFRRGPNGEARIVTTLSDAQTGINIRQQAKGVVVDFIGTDLPAAMQRRLDVTDFATPVSQVESYALGENSRMVIDAKGTWEYSAYQTDNQFIVEVRPVVDENRKTADGKPIYKGEKLSLNFQNVEVRSVLQVIADFTGLNIVASDTVGGSLTLRLKDVPWDQALDLILTTKGLDKRTNGNVIWIAPRDELLNKEKAELEARASVSDLEPMVTEYIPLNYLRADEAQAMLYGANLSGIAGGGKASCSVASEGVTSSTTQAAGGAKDEDKKILSKRGRASYELKTNMLIINDTARKIQEVRDLLAKIDVAARQVMIEARVVIADDTFARQLGARLGTRVGGTSKIGGSQTGIGFASGLNDSFALANGTPTGTTLPNVDLGIGSTLSGASPATLGLTLLNIATGNLISLELQALEADNRGKVISNPRVVTTNQKPAVILQGVQIPYSTAESGSTGGTGTNTVQFVDAFLCLLVDPQILNNDSVILNVEVQKDAPGQTSAAGLPAIDRRRVKTQVRVNNGETVVLGGIYETINRNDVNKVPFLGDLPFLGYLFKNTDRREIKTEVMIFLTPRILDERLSLR